MCKAKMITFLKKRWPLLTTVVVAIQGVAMLVVARLSSPRPQEFAVGSITANRIEVHERPYLMIDGPGLNCNGQLQCNCVEIDTFARKFVVETYIVLRIPFSAVVINQQYPILVALTGLPAGEYSVLYRTDQGEAVAGKIAVP